MKSTTIPGIRTIFNLATTGGSLQTIGFAATGTIVDIVYLDDAFNIANSTYGAGNWDFAIDNVTFDQPLGTSATPLPATLPLFAGGLGFVGYLAKRRKERMQRSLS